MHATKTCAVILRIAVICAAVCRLVCQLNLYIIYQCFGLYDHTVEWRCTEYAFVLILFRCTMWLVSFVSLRCGCLSFVCLTEGLILLVLLLTCQVALKVLWTLSHPTLSGLEYLVYESNFVIWMPRKEARYWEQCRITCHHKLRFFCQILILKVWGWLICGSGWKTRAYVCGQLSSERWWWKASDIMTCVSCNEYVHSMSVWEYYDVLHMSESVMLNKSGACSVLGSLKPDHLPVMRPLFSQIGASL